MIIIIMSKNQVFLCEWSYMINFNENENDKEKTDRMNKTWIDQDLDIVTNVQNITCLGKRMPLCNKQRISNIWGSIH